jgi:uncharacterized membrane protein YeaQ/YmgE (transglycosylase-associated protein family)
MGLFELIKIAIVGLIVGLLARLLLPGRDPMGFILTAILGIAGALLGTFVGRNLLHLRPNYSAGWLMSIAGAIILLLIYRLIAGRRT